jgi:hypothetical protein
LPAGAADPGKEISTAAAHAGMAAGAEDPQMVKAHLHHVLNCLEGPSGADFNAAPGNPCKDLGNGAIPDSAADSRKSLEAAVALAKQGLSEMDISKAKAKASEVQSALSK